MRVIDKVAGQYPISDSTTILNIIDISRRWCKPNFGPLRAQVKSRHFPERIDARKQYFYFLYIFLGIIGRKRLGQPFCMIIWIYHYLLDGVRLDLDLEKYFTLLQTTLTFGFSHTKHSLIYGNRTCWT